MSKAAELAALIGGQKALGDKNIIKNGAMVVAQRATSAASDTTGTPRTVDRMYPEIGSAGTWTQSQSTDVPSGQGFVNSFKLDCTTADASLAAGDYVLFGYRLEGLELQRLNYGTSGAKNIVLSFWVKTNKTGNYVVQMQNIITGGTNKACSLLYTISSANTWQKVEFPIPADTAAAFDNDNALTGILYWWLAAGTNWTSGTLDTTWGNITNANLSVGQNVNLADSTDNEWYITGIQLEEGDVATPFEHEDFGTTLLKCQRYYQINYASWYGVAAASGYFVSSNITYKPDLRANPAVAQESFSSGSGGRFTATAATSSSINGTTIYSSPGSSGGNSGYQATWSADAEL